MKIFTYLEKFIEMVAIFFFCLMLLATFIQVVSRYFFTPITWTEELARYSYVWLVYMGSIVLQKNNKHIRLDLLDKFIPEKLEKYFELTFRLLLLYICYHIVISGYKFSITMGRAMSTVMPIPLKYLYIVIPISFGLILLFTLVQVFVELIKGAK